MKNIIKLFLIFSLFLISIIANVIGNSFNANCFNCYSLIENNLEYKNPTKNYIKTTNNNINIAFNENNNIYTITNNRNQRISQANSSNNNQSSHKSKTNPFSKNINPALYLKRTNLFFNSYNNIISQNETTNYQRAP